MDFGKAILPIVAGILIVGLLVAFLTPVVMDALSDGMDEAGGTLEYTLSETYEGNYTVNTAYADTIYGWNFTTDNDTYWTIEFWDGADTNVVANITWANFTAGTNTVVINTTDGAVVTIHEDYNRADHPTSVWATVQLDEGEVVGEWGDAETGLFGMFGILIIIVIIITIMVYVMKVVA